MIKFNEYTVYLFCLLLSLTLGSILIGWHFESIKLGLGVFLLAFYLKPQELI